MDTNQILYLIFIGTLIFYGVGILIFGIVYGISCLVHYRFLEMRDIIIGKENRIEALVDRNRELVSEVKDYYYREKLNVKGGKK